MSLYGAVTVRARLLPLVNLGMDLLVGGPQLVLQSLTGLAAAFAYNFLRGMAPAGHIARPTMLQRLAQLAKPPQVLRQWLTQGRVNSFNRTTRTSSFGTAYSSAGAARSAPSWGGLFSRGNTTGAPSSQQGTRPAARTNASADRAAVLAATEARLRQRANSQRAQDK